MNITEYVKGIKLCPQCGGLLVFRQYSEQYEEFDVAPDTGEISEEEFDSVTLGESDWLIYCKGKGGEGCGWEVRAGEAAAEGR